MRVVGIMTVLRATRRKYPALVEILLIVVYCTYPIPPFTMLFDDGDDTDDTTENEPKTGDYDLGDDIGERVGEGHDPIEDTVL